MTKSVYTDAMVARLKEAAPLNAEKCAELAAEFGNVSARSVIAKAKSEGVEYVVKTKPAAKKLAPSKADVVAEIRAAREGGSDFDGLVKAPMSALVALRDNLTAE